MKITGNTYEWKKQLAAAGFRWNAQTKSWDRDGELNTADFGDRMIANGIESGDLLVGSGKSVLPRNAREAFEFESGVRYE